jgi:HTH-type transcriptional regulator/antitoxin HigA
MIEITKEEYEECLKKLETLFDAKPNTKEGEELERLVKLIVEYENKHYPI